MNRPFYFHKANGAWYRVLSVNCNWRPSEGCYLLVQLSPATGNWESDHLTREAALNRVFLTNHPIPVSQCHKVLPDPVKRHLAWLVGIDYSTWLIHPETDIRPMIDHRQYRAEKPLDLMIDKRQAHRVPRRDPLGLASLHAFLERAQIPPASYLSHEESCWGK